MTFHKTEIEGIYSIELSPINDERGFFVRSFCEKELQDQGLTFRIAQINQSFTKHKGTIRGMHFQREPKAEGKIVQCVQGSIFDVAVDIRKDSKTFGKWVGLELSEDNNKMLYISKGLAHGLQTLSDNCRVMYYMSEFYSPEHATGVLWNDPIFNVSWPIDDPLLSPKDKSWSKLGE